MQVSSITSITSLANWTLSMSALKAVFMCQTTCGRSPTSSKGNWKGGGQTDRKVANKKLKMSLINPKLLHKTHTQKKSKTYIHTYKGKQPLILNTPLSHGRKKSRNWQRSTQDTCTQLHWSTYNTFRTTWPVTAPTTQKRHAVKLDHSRPSRAPEEL